MHGEENQFEPYSTIARTLKADDALFVTGDFGYIFRDDFRERKFLQTLAEEMPFLILWVDGNHENFDALNQYPVEEWCGGKVHVVGRDKNGEAKVIHLMRGQVFEIGGKKIFTFGGAYSLDKAMRCPGKSWWKEEMPTGDEKQEGIENLKKHNYKVDYVITHTAPEETMMIFGLRDPKEIELNRYLELVRDMVDYERWWFGHLHEDKECFRNQTAICWKIRDMETNEVVGER